MHGRGPSRRDFLKGLGATGAGLVAGSMGTATSAPPAGAAPLPPAARPRHYGHGAPASAVDFGRIFPHLPPFSEANDTVRAALLEAAGRAGSWTPAISCRPARRR